MSDGSTCGFARVSTTLSKLRAALHLIHSAESEAASDPASFSASTRNFWSCTLSHPLSPLARQASSLRFSRGVSSHHTKCSQCFRIVCGPLYHRTWNHARWDVENSKGVWETEVRWRSVIDQTGTGGPGGAGPSRSIVQLQRGCTSQPDGEARMPADAHPEMPPAPVLLMHATRRPPGPPLSAQGRQRLAISARIIAKRSPQNAEDAESLFHRSSIGDLQNSLLSTQSNACVCPRFDVHSHANNTSMNLSPEAFLCSCLTAFSCISGNLQLNSSVEL
ncbi:uncharacterized protein PSANT_05992 [Moesziomyces antarcticus]|uniref:Uncharacterized protein n=1 Tax=Pseudozyma antarctica TaxID=84753 RepID=A0A5C3FV71_PSEA2|nr:uncharacterized protein PSANT_05992 [Moesziomyces antarcticus]